MPGKTRLTLFGPVELCHSNGMRVSFKTRRGRALLAFLALRGGEEVLREELIEAIWPDTELSVGRNRLSTELSYLQREFRKHADLRSLIETDMASLRLRVADLAIDHSGIKELIANVDDPAGEIADREAALQEVLDRTATPLLADISADWVEDARQDFENGLTVACLSLARSLRAKGEAERAFAWVQRVAGRSKSNGALLLAMVRLAVEAKRPSEAMLYFEQYREHLASLGLEPSAEESELFQIARRRLAQGGARRKETLKGKRLNFPTWMDHFVGREAEMASLSNLCAHARLVTVVGLGGVGKTRLVTELTLASRDTVIWISLSEVTTNEGFNKAVIESLEQRDSAGRGLDLVLSLLKDRRVIFVFDNFEHLPDACSQSVARILSACPQVSCVVTSRRTLGLAAELVYHLQPLATPPLNLPSHQALQSESMRLLIDRIAHARPDFTFGSQSADILAAICRRLDGLPLALELIAARFAFLGEAEIEDELQRPSTLSSTDIDRDPRHQTLVRAIEWNFKQLSDPAVEVLAAICTFAGYCSLARLRDLVPQVDLVPCLAEITKLSLLSTQMHEGRMRYGALFTIRDVVGQLAPAQRLLELRHRHARMYYEESVRARPLVTTAKSTQTLENLDAEFEELLSAIRFYQGEQPEIAVEMLMNLEHFWFLRRRQGQILPLYRDLAFLQHPWSARVLRAYAFLAHVMGHLDEANLALCEAYRRAKESGDRCASAASALLISYPSYGQTNRFEWLDEAVAECDGSPPWKSFIECEIAIAKWQTSQFEEAKLVMLQAIESAESTRCDWIIRQVLVEQSHLQFYAGEFIAAKSCIVRHHELSKRILGSSQKPTEPGLLGTVELFLGNYEAARRIISVRVENERRVGLMYSVSTELSRLGHLEAKCLRCDEALEHEKEASQTREAIGYPGHRLVSARHHALIAFHSGNLSETEFWLRQVFPSGLSPRDVQGTSLLCAHVSFSKAKFVDARTFARDVIDREKLHGNRYVQSEALDLLAAVDCAEGRMREAASNLRSALALRDEIGAILPPADRIWRDPVAELVQSELGDELRQL